MAKLMKSTNINSNNFDINKVKIIEEIKTKTILILENRKNVNYLIDLLTSLNQTVDKLMIETIVRSFNKVFVRFIHNKEMVINSEESEANLKYKNWLIIVYNKSIDAFIHVMSNNSNPKSTQKLALNCLMKFVAEEGLYYHLIDLIINY
jgi:hypothetical protein